MNMTYEERLARAERMRSGERFGVVTQEELDEFPANQTEFYLDRGNEKPIHIYRIAPETLADHCPMIINFHGGGFIKGRSGKDQLFCSRLALEFRCLVWDVDYSLAPEYPFPEAVHEAYDVVEYAFAHAQELNVDPEQIILAGHSAGGNLAVTVCMKAGETKAFQPAGLIAEFFPADLYTDPADKIRIEGDMPAEVAKTYNAFYCEGEIAKNPYASPAFAREEQLKAFPDTLIMTGGRDSLCFEAEEFAKKLAGAGVTVISRRFVNSLHGFTINRTDEWKDSMKLIESFIATHITKPE
jgi:acetyl esterase